MASEAKLTNPRRPIREGRLITVAQIEDLPSGMGAAVELPGGKEVALYNVGNQFYAIENFCPHRGAQLADGELRAQTVECKLHNWLFDLRTGACLTQKDYCVETYEVKIENGEIKILI